LTDEELAPEGKAPPAIHSLELPCPSCGETTAHRVVHIRSYRSKSLLSGVARCGRCKATHPFQVENRTMTVKMILSDGPTSRRLAFTLKGGERVEKDQEFEVEGRKVKVVRIETASAPSAISADPQEVRVLWTVPSDFVMVKISIVRGRNTQPFKVRMPVGLHIAVGDTVRIEGKRTIVTGVRIRGRTQKITGAGGEAREIQRVYVLPEAIYRYRQTDEYRESE
jgi:uncharacterized Zn finger protein